MKKASLLVSVILLGQASGITLEEAIVAAYNSSNSWFANQVDKTIADEAYKQSQMAFLPSVTGSLSCGIDRVNNFNRNVGRHNNTTEKTKKVGIAVQHNLFRGYSNINAMNANGNKAKAALYQLKYNEAALITKVVDAYTGVWAGRQKVDALKKKEENLQKALESQRTTLEAGAGTQSEVALASANYQKAVYERINAETELFTAESNFEKLTGMKADENIELPSIDIPLPNSLDELIAEATAANPAVLYSKFNEMAAYDNLKAVKGRLAPSCDVVLQAGRNLSRPSSIMSGTYNDHKGYYGASLNVSVPLFENGSSGNTYSAIAIANQEALKLTFSARDTIQEVKKECVVNWNSYISARAMIEASRSAVQSAEVSSASNTEANNLGVKSNTDVWVQENQLYEARVGLTASLRQRLIAYVQLLSLMGKLSLTSILKTE